MHAFTHLNAAVWPAPSHAPLTSAGQPLETQCGPPLHHAQDDGGEEKAEEAEAAEKAEEEEEEEEGGVG